MVPTAEGCFWIDADGDGAKGASETCQAGQTLHAVVKDDSGTIVTGSDVDFTTNALGSGGKFSYSLPVPPTGKTWTITISEVAPNGYVNIVPVGGSTTKSYSALAPTVGGFSFGNKQVVVCTAPSITSQPSGATKNAGQSVTFSVSAGGTTPLTYQWRKNGADISGETDSICTISSVASNDAGTYDVVVSNSCGSLTSSGAILALNKGTPVITWTNPARYHVWD